MGGQQLLVKKATVFGFCFPSKRITLPPQKKCSAPILESPLNGQPPSFSGQTKILSILTSPKRRRYMCNPTDRTDKVIFRGFLAPENIFGCRNITISNIFSRCLSFLCFHPLARAPNNVVTITMHSTY